MVTQGQFLERPTLIPVGREVMEGTAHRGTRVPPLLVIPPRPEEGGGMDHVVCSELVWAAASAGHPTLRFNHRGVGASQGQRGGLASLVEDAEAALRVLIENTGVAEVAVAALEGGAEVALALAEQHRALAGLCLVSPGTLRLDALARLSTSLCVVAGTEDPRLLRAALAASVTEAGGTLEWVEDEGPPFPRSLPQVGRAMSRWLTRLADRL